MGGDRQAARSYGTGQYFASFSPHLSVTDNQLFDDDERSGDNLQRRQLCRYIFYAAVYLETPSSRYHPGSPAPPQTANCFYFFMHARVCLRYASSLTLACLLYYRYSS